MVLFQETIYTGHGGENIYQRSNVAIPLDLAFTPALSLANLEFSFGFLANSTYRLQHVASTAIIYVHICNRQTKKLMPGTVLFSNKSNRNHVNK